MSEMRKTKQEIILPAEKLTYLQNELTNIREEFEGNKYIQEALIVLKAGGLRSTIGCYWNAVIDDLRRKIIHRSLDLFNKEMNLNGKIKQYEDFQTFITDFDLIEGAYKIGVFGWEAKKLLHHARETRNIFDGHPDSSDPTLFKVFNMIADCNRYVLSQDYPQSIIDTDEYILQMDSINFNRNELAVEQAFVDLPEIYKSEIANKFFSAYLQDNISTTLRANIEFCCPILWKVLPKEARLQIGKRFDKEMIAGHLYRIDKGIDFLSFVNGMRYISTASRNIIFEPPIKFLEDNLDNWHVEGTAVQNLKRLGNVIPEDLIFRYMSCITSTYVGYSGYYSYNASPIIAAMFGTLDNAQIEAYIEVLKTNTTVKARVKRNPKCLQRLRNLTNIILNECTIQEGLMDFLNLIVDTSKTNDFFRLIK